jgi:hypothetical protein
MLALAVGTIILAWAFGTNASGVLRSFFFSTREADRFPVHAALGLATVLHLFSFVVAILCRQPSRYSFSWIVGSASLLLADFAWLANIF